MRSLLVFSLLFITSGYCTQLYKDYCIIGAGPSGLQMGYFLKSAGRDYVIFEKNGKAGRFFEKYPRHRKLISINKRFTGKINREFNLRHDWNSLISHDENLLFTKYSKEYFPHADVMLQYLDDFQRKLEIDVQFYTEISNVTFHKSNEYRFSMQDQKNNNYFCKTLFIGTGFPIPNKPLPSGHLIWIRHLIRITKPRLTILCNALTVINLGEEFIEGYEDIPIDPANYTGQSVLIFGKGNSAFEVAASIYGHTAAVHIIGRERIRFSWETHYVGDLRALNNEVLDAYMLKSLDAVLEASMSDVNFVRRADGKIQPEYEFSDSSPDKWENLADNFPIRNGYDRVIRCLGFTWDKSIFHNSTIPQNYMKRVSFGVRVHRVEKSKFPDINFDYQSTQFEGMYFIGPLAHSLDYRKAAGGFIHGFRYTARTLHRLLEFKNHKIPWPFIENPIEKIASTFLKRANEGSGIYQMFGNLADIAIINRKTDSFIYLEEFPLNLLHELSNRTGHEVQIGVHNVVVMVLDYGYKWSEPGVDHFDITRAHAEDEDAHLSNFLHPVFYYYHKLPTENEMDLRRKNETLPKPSGVRHIIEDFNTAFDGPNTHVAALRTFLEYFLQTDLKIYSQASCLEKTIYENPEQLPVYCRKLAKTEESIFTL